MYKGIKDFISEFKEPFDKNAKSLKEAKSRLKEKGDKATLEAVKEEQQVVLAEWKKAQERGIKLHKQIQDKKSKIVKCVIEGWEKPSKKKGTPNSDDNKLKNNTTYLEKRVVSEKYKLVGYSDEVKVKNNFINIEDGKTCQTIYRSSGIKTRTGYLVPPTYYYPPINKLQTCNFNDAALQMSLYMYILWTHNKKLKPGKLFIRHIKTNSSDKITEEILIEVPYLRDEVKAMLKTRLQDVI